MSRASVDDPDFVAANKHPSLLWPWLVLSAIWIAGVLFFEPLAGRSSRALVALFLDGNSATLSTAVAA